MPNWLAGERKSFSRLVIEGGGEIGVGVMSFEKWLKTKGSHSVKDAYEAGYDEGESELEKQADLLNDTIQVLTRRQDAATECFDQRTRQLLAWANEITKAAGKEVEGMQTAEDGVAHLAEAARQGGPPLPAPAIADACHPLKHDHSTKHDEHSHWRPLS